MRERQRGKARALSKEKRDWHLALLRRQGVPPEKAAAVLATSASFFGLDLPADDLRSLIVSPNTGLEAVRISGAIAQQRILHSAAEAPYCHVGSDTSSREAGVLAATFSFMSPQGPRVRCFLYTMAALGTTAVSLQGNGRASRSGLAASVGGSAILVVLFARV